MDEEGEGHPIFPAFFRLAVEAVEAVFPIPNVNIFKIFFLDMIGMAFYHNKSKFVSKFHSKF